MDRWLALALCISVGSGLSCAVPRTPQMGAAEPEQRKASVPPVDTDVAAVEAVLARHATGLVHWEVRSAAETIVREAKQNGLEPKLVLAVVQTESGYYNFARSNVGALGLMQIMPATGEMLARELEIEWSGPDLLFQPEVNVRMGTRYLAFLKRRYGSLERALAAYNWGPGEIDRRIKTGVAVPVEYSSKVQSRLAQGPTLRAH